MKKEKIRVLLIAPMERPKAFLIKPTMQRFKKLVGADKSKHSGIEAKRLEKNLYVVFNKDRFLTNLKANRRIGDDILGGNMLIVAIDEGRQPVSLTDDQALRYALRFWNAETFDDMDIVEANLHTLFARFLKDEDNR